MPVYLGGTAVKAFYVGATAAKAVYSGANKAWPSGFDPKSLAGLNVWLDASQIPGGAITTAWPDLSGSGHDGTIVGSPAPTIRSAALNGLPVVRFKPNEGRVRGNNGLASGVPSYNFTLVYVSRMVGPGVGRIHTSTYPPPNFLIGYHTSGQDWMYDNGQVGPGASPYGTLPTPWKLYAGTGSHDGTTYQVQFYKDTVLIGGSGSGGGMGTTYNLSGYDASGTQETCDGEVAELLIYNRRLADAERQQVEGYLKGKWGLP